MKYGLLINEQNCDAVVFTGDMINRESCELAGMRDVLSQIKDNCTQQEIDAAYGKLSNEVLTDLSLSVEEGQVLSIIGPSGSGKSTKDVCKSSSYAVPITTQHYGGVGGQWFKDYGPVGCRDLYTCRKMESAGIPNYFSSALLLKSLVGLPAFIVYPCFSAGTLLIVTLISVPIFKERLGVKSWIGLVLITGALVLLNI